MKVKKLTKAVVVTLSNAEIGDLYGVLGHVDLRHVSKRELALTLKLAGLSETVFGSRNIFGFTDEHRTRPEYEAASRAVRGLWQTVRV
jgi:hypothetical protein